MKTTKGVLVFEPNNEEYFIFEQKVWPQHTRWGSYVIAVKARFECGKLFTNQGNPVDAMLHIKNSVEFEIFNTATNRFLRNSQDYLKQVKVDFTCNCFGYCFTNGKYWIENPKQIIEDDYDITTDTKKAKKIILMATTTDMGVGNGTPVRRCIHGVNINPDMSVSFKPGFWELNKRVAINQYRIGYNSEQEILIKPKF